MSDQDLHEDMASRLPREPWDAVLRRVSSGFPAMGGTGFPLNVIRGHLATSPDPANTISVPVSPGDSDLFHGFAGRPMTVFRHIEPQLRPEPPLLQRHQPGQGHDQLEFESAVLRAGGTCYQAVRGDEPLPGARWLRMAQQNCGNDGAAQPG